MVTKKAKNSNRLFMAVTVIAVCLMIVGVCLLMYPWVANWWNQRHQGRAIAAYGETVAQMDDTDYSIMLSEAQEYNEWLRTNPKRFIESGQDHDWYNSLLNIGDTGMMAYLEIPAIDVYLPVYHGTSDVVLQVAVGHIEGSSLPIGGPGTHTALSGHSALRSALLFTNLTKLKVGDVFYIHVLNETHEYTVDQILTVEPDDVSALGIVDGEDYTTLITCTPYGVNTHRLLVRGVRSG